MTTLGATLSAQGRFELHDPIASGGMAAVHLGRMRTGTTVMRTVAIKRMHRHLLTQPDVAAMFFDEARLAMRIQHPNVVTTLDVIATGGELLLVMDFVLGESLDRLLLRAREDGRRPPVACVCGVIAGALAGLHAAHEARDEAGAPLSIVHRDVSPQNILVGVDGVPRIIDFGVASAAGRLHTTEHGQVKGKLAYMAPEQLALGKLDRRVDVFAAAVVLWEGLTGRRLFAADSPALTMVSVLEKPIEAPSTFNPEVSAALDAVVMKGLARHGDLRFASAREMAAALEQACAPATARAIGEWVEREAGDAVRARAQRVAEVESRSTATPAASPGPALLAGTTRPEPTLPPHDDVMASSQEPTVDATKPGSARIGGVVTTAAPPAAARTQTRARSRRWRLLAAAAVVALVAVPTLLLRARAGATDPHAGSAPVASDSPGATPGSAVPSPAANPAVTMGESAAASTTTPPSPASRARARPAGPAPAHKPDCANPFTISRDGIRVPRPECF